MSKRSFWPLALLPALAALAAAADLAGAARDPAHPAVGPLENIRRPAAQLVFTAGPAWRPEASPRERSPGPPPGTPTHST